MVWDSCCGKCGTRCSAGERRGGESRHTWSFITLYFYGNIYNTKILVWKITNSYTTNSITKIIIFLHTGDFSTCVCLYCVCLYHRALKRVRQPLRLEWQLWTATEVPRTKPRSSGTAASTPNCCAITPAPAKVFLIKYLHYDHRVVQRNVLNLIIKTQLYISTASKGTENWAALYECKVNECMA